jgi:hypothetical protein
MELKNVGKVGLVKRKQFLQKRDFSRSHEVIKILSYLVFICKKKKFILRNIDDVLCRV